MPDFVSAQGDESVPVELSCGHLFTPHLFFSLSFPEYGCVKSLLLMPPPPSPFLSATRGPCESSRVGRSVGEERQVAGAGRNEKALARRAGLSASQRRTSASRQR